MDIVNSVSFIKETDDRKLNEVLFKIGSLAFVSNIGATKWEVAKYLGTSIRTIEKYLKDYNSEFRNYGETVFEREMFDTDDFVGHKINTKMRKLTLLNKRHILLLACLLMKRSDIARSIVRYLFELEGVATVDLKIRALESSLAELSGNEGLLDKIKILESKLSKSQYLIEFAESIQCSGGDITIGDFAKINYDKFKLGRNRIFSLMRKLKILNSNNVPKQCYINNNYFKVKEISVNCHIKTQPLITGKGQLWLFNRISKGI